MKDLFDILKKIGAENRQAYLDTMAYCDTRVTADEGIPAVIALDDLTRPDHDVAYAPPEADRDLGMLLAAQALLYTSLYEARPKKPGDKYPSICPALSAAAESCFLLAYGPDGDFEVRSYGEETGAFGKPKAQGREEG